jgi:hypothetical protein
MKSQKIEELKIKELNEALDFAETIERKLHEFNTISAKVAESEGLISIEELLSTRPLE